MNIRFWWDFSSPGKLPLVLESDMEGLDTSDFKFYSLGAADNAVTLLSDLDAHKLMSTDRVLDRILDRICKD